MQRQTICVLGGRDVSVDRGFGLAATNHSVLQALSTHGMTTGAGVPSAQVLLDHDSRRDAVTGFGELHGLPAARTGELHPGEVELSDNRGEE